MSSEVEGENSCGSLDVSRAIEVLVVEDRPLSRSALRQLLSEHMPTDKLADASGLEKALQISTKFKPSVVLINYQLRTSNAITIAKAVQRQSPTSDVLFVSMQESWIALATAIQSGREGLCARVRPAGLDH